jgi:hypothetical protein
MIPLRVLELGNFVVPAYCGMILAEQGATVEKWTNGKDPILGCRSGAELWAWINHGKMLVNRPVASLPGDPPSVDIVIDNFRPSTLAGWGVDPAALTERHGWVWVSMRSEVGERSFDLIAQARSIREYGPHVPFWLGDTAGGLWVAFKAPSMCLAGKAGHYVLGQSSVLKKLVEGELQVERPEPLPGNVVPWDPDPYFMTDELAVIDYKGERLEEPIRLREWKLEKLWHVNGRMRV